MLKLAGTLLIFNALFITGWWFWGEHNQNKWAFALCLLAIFVGVFLILEDRVTELTIKGVGTIKSAVKQAIADANSISDLKTRVEAQSATVDLVAQEAADAKELVNDLSEKNLKAEEKLSQLDNAISEGNIAVNELQRYTQFNTTVISAQSGNRPAYDQVWAWAEDSSFPFRKEATQAAQTIMDQHNPGIVMSGFDVPWNEGIDPQKLSLPDILRTFKSVPPHVRIGIVEFVWIKRTDITKLDRLEFLIDVIRNDEDLKVVEYAGRYFARGTENNFKPIAIGSHLKWWEENKDSIE